MTNLDKLDHLLIARLREDARAPVAELARSLGVSRTTVQSRIARLERAKVITGYSVRLAESFEKNQIHAYVMITVGPKRAAARQRGDEKDAGRAAAAVGERCVRHDRAGRRRRRCGRWTT